jgi:hypothetical protein
MFNWLWKYIVRYVARKKGFIDPIAMFARISAIGQPAETAAPIELLRAGAVLHARGFMNNNVIQHNLDWVWPFWVERQFDPNHPSFIPRSFSMTHINITQRNWTAVGYPGCEETPVADARGLVMPFFDSWSLEGWFVPDAGESLLPSRTAGTTQRLEWTPNLRLVTTTSRDGSRLVSTAEVARGPEGHPVLRLTLHIAAARAGWLTACVRPYNAEGVSFVNDLSWLPGGEGWRINEKDTVRFSRPPEKRLLSNYRDGDVYLALRQKKLDQAEESVSCGVGMATGAALYRVQASGETEMFLEVPLGDAATALGPEESWRAALAESAAFSGEERFEFLYQTSLHTAVLLSPREIYAGPYTYKRFWYRDAAIILHALMCAGHRSLAENSLDFFVAGQKLTGYFKSQEGEWDSNGQVLWAIGRYCRLFDAPPKPAWVPAIRKAVQWIARKRKGTLAAKDRHGGIAPHAGLLPAGFSAEHFGPNDHYYWDDFWTVGGLRLAEEMLRGAGEAETADLAAREALEVAEALDRSLRHTARVLGTPAMPVSPYRRLDSANVGSLAAGFPLQLWPASDPRLAATVDYLCERCLIHDAFYHDISHSGINAYLTLHIAQCLLRAGDPRFRRLMKGIAELASPTGHWPEAIHPQLRTGCMGDGQHAWAAAEWMLMIRNCFLFDEEFENKVVVGAGLSADWCAPGRPARYGPAPTRFGPVTVSLESNGTELELTWKAEWRGVPPEVEVRFEEPGWEPRGAEPGRHVYRRAGGAA